ncbi:MAG: ABC transporter substrate-binding protein [Aliidongia sp.]
MRYKVTSLMAAASVAALVAATARAEDIQVGVAGPVTGSNASFGEQLTRGAQQAVEDINAKGGVLGKKLVLNTGDDACDPKQAVAVAHQLVSKKVVFVDGDFCSSSSIPASAVYQEEGVLQSARARPTRPLPRMRPRNTGRMSIGPAAATTPRARSPANIWPGISPARRSPSSTTNRPTAKGLADETRKAMNAAGLKEAVNEQIAAGDKDFSALISKLKQANVEAIYFGGYQTEAGLLVRQAKEQA